MYLKHPIVEHVLDTHTMDGGPALPLLPRSFVKQEALTRDQKREEQEQ